MARAAKGEGSFFKTDTGWRGYVTVNGRRRYFSASTKAEAAHKRRKLVNQRESTGLAVGKRETLGGWIAHWLTITESAHKPTTHAGYKYLTEKYISKELAQTPLTKLTVEHLEDEYKRLEKKGLAGSTRAQIHSIIHSALKTAQQRGHVPINYAALVADKPRAKKTPVRALSESDVAAIEKVIHGKRYAARWHLALALGLRPAEALALEWRDVDLEAGTIHVRQQLQKIDGETILVPSAKTDAGNRKIPLPRYLATMLREHREAQLRERVNDVWRDWSPDDKPHAWVFTSARRPGRPVTDDGDSSQWRKILIAAGVPHVRRYTSRHTAASVLIGHGIDPATVAAILGHNDPGFTMRTYVHAIDERVKGAMDILDQDRVQNKVQHFGEEAHVGS